MQPSRMAILRGQYLRWRGASWRISWRGLLWRRWSIKKLLLQTREKLTQAVRKETCCTLCPHFKSIPAPQAPRTQGQPPWPHGTPAQPPTSDQSVEEKIKKVKAEGEESRFHLGLIDSNISCANIFSFLHSN